MIPPPCLGPFDFVRQGYASGHIESPSLYDNYYLFENGYYTLRNKIINSFGEGLRVNPFYVSAKLSQAILWARYELRRVFHQQGQMTDLKELIKPEFMETFSFYPRDDLSLTSSVGITQQVDMIKLNEFTTAMRESFIDRSQPLYSSLRPFADTVEPYSAAYEPDDLYQDQEAWDIAVAQSRQNWNTLQDLYVQIQTIKDPWVLEDAPLRDLPGTRFDLEELQDLHIDPGSRDPQQVADDEDRLVTLSIASLADFRAGWVNHVPRSPTHLRRNVLYPTFAPAMKFSLPGTETL